MRVRTFTCLPLLWLLGLVLAASDSGALARNSTLATIELEATRFGDPLIDPTICKFYVYEPEKREHYVAWGHGAKSVKVKPGLYDIVVRYRNDLVRSEQTFSEVKILADYVVKADFELAEAELQLDITRGGEPVPRFAAQYKIHEAGKRGKPLTARRPGTTVVLRPGRYDIEVTLRDGRGLKSTWLENYRVEDRHIEVIEMGLPPTRLTIEIVDEGRSLTASQAGFAVFRPGETRRSIRDAGSGQSLGLPAGRYDIALYDRTSRSTRPVRWIRDVEVRGETRRELALMPQAATRLTVSVLNRGDRLTEAWYHVYRVGERRRPLQAARSGETVEIEEGLYDIVGFVHDRGIVGERWLPSRRIAGATEVQLDLRIEPATLRLKATSPRRTTQPRREMIILMDSSASMDQMLSGTSRLRSASQELIDALGMLEGTDIRVGIRAFGIAPRSRRNCRDSARLLKTAPLDVRRVSRSLDLLRPGGYSPIADTLRRVAEDADSEAYTVVVLLAGSYENCGGDPCAAAARLLYEGIADEIHVIGIGLEPARWSSFTCVGTFHAVDSRRRLRTVLRRLARTIQGGSEDVVSVFRPGGREWIVTAPLGETIPIAAGRYDLRMRNGTQRFTWNNFEIRGDIVGRAGEKP